MNGSDVVAGSLFNTLTNDMPYEIPTVDLEGTKYNIPNNPKVYAPIEELSVGGLTNAVSTGVFDVLMSSMKKHLKEEYESGRITGSEYTKLYTAQSQVVLNTSIQFMNMQVTSYWQAVSGQAAAIVSQVQIETGKLEYATGQMKAKTVETEYAVNKVKLATEDAAYGVNKYNLSNLMPAQLKLLNEQLEVQRAQTSDTRSDGTTPVNGVLGKQRALYTQQITSYQRDAEMKATKLFTDAWITMKTIDEGLLPPSNFQNTSLDGILTRIKQNNDLV